MYGYMDVCFAGVACVCVCIYICAFANHCVHLAHSRYSGYLLYWYKSTNTDAAYICAFANQCIHLALLRGGCKILAYDALSY